MKKILAFTVSTAIAFCPLLADPTETSDNPNRILASEFPRISSQVKFFEIRINSKDSAIRLELVSELSSSNSSTDKDYINFLKRMYQDADPQVRGHAIKKLHGMWINQDPKTLPLSFIGYHNDQLIDRGAATTANQLIKECEAGGVGAGYAAYVVGILQIKEAIPALKKLAGDDNVFVRFSAARALFDCGEKLSAITISNEIISSGLKTYASFEKLENAAKARLQSDTHPFYIIGACETLIKIGGENERRQSIKHLIELMEFLERSSDVNDRSSIASVRNTLAEHTNEYFTSSKEASDWINREQ